MTSTSETEATKYKAKDNRIRLAADNLWSSTAARHQEIAEMETGPHPFAPKIPLYLRPAIVSLPGYVYEGFLKFKNPSKVANGELRKRTFRKSP